MKVSHVWGVAAGIALTLALGISTSARADVSNGGFELGTAVGNPDNATDWNWTPNPDGERVNTLTNSNVDNGTGSSGGTHLIDPFAGSWFGYAENTSADASAEVSQNVVIDPNNPVLTFWWRFFTNETPGVENTFNDRFQVDVEGSLSLLQTVASVNSTAMITTNGPLWTPTSPGAGDPGQNQSFAHYTSGWAFYSLNASAMAGETVTVYFRVSDVGGPHDQSSGFALDNIQFVAAPEPASLALLGMGGLMLIRRRRST